MEPKRLYRVQEGRMVCGVCQGLAEYFTVDVSIIRILWVAATLCCSFGFWAYLLCAIILPDKTEIR